MHRAAATTLAALATLCAGCALAPPRSPALGAEVQVYPAGVIPGVHAQVPLSPADVLTLRAAYNFTDRQDFGEHDHEDGGGPGGGVGYRHYFGPGRTGWLVGARADLWFLNIDWRDDAGASGPARSGSTDVVVLQPTVEGGYRFRLGPTLDLDLALGAGFEINVNTDGEDVGEGGIVLLGATFAFGPNDPMP